MRILTGKMKPIQVFLAPEEGGGGGGLGSAFSTLLSTMSTENPGTPIKSEEPKEPKKEKAKKEEPKKEEAKVEEPPPGETPPPEPKKEEPKKSEAKKTEEKKKPEIKKDAVLEMLSEQKKAEAPEPTEEEKAEAAKRTAEIDAATKGLSPKAAENFRTIASARDAAEQKAAALQKELEGIKTSRQQLPPDITNKLTRLSQLEQEHAQLTEMMEKIGAERSPTYQNKFIKGREALVKKASDMVKKYGGNDEQFQAALGLSGRERSEVLQEALQEMHPLDQQRITGVLAEIENLDEEGTNFLANAKQALIREEQEAQQIEHQQYTQMIQAREEAFFQVANKMLHRLPDDHPLAAEANPMVDKAIEDAKQFLFNGKNFNDFAEASIAKAMYPVVQKKLFDAAQKIAELEAQIEELTSAEPGGGGSGGGGGKEPEEKKGFADRYKGAMTGAAT